MQWRRNILSPSKSLGLRVYTASHSKMTTSSNYQCTHTSMRKIFYVPVIQHEEIKTLRSCEPLMSRQHLNVASVCMFTYPRWQASRRPVLSCYLPGMCSRSVQRPLASKVWIIKYIFTTVAHTWVIESSAVALAGDAGPAQLHVCWLGERIAERTGRAEGIPTLHGTHLLALATGHGALQTVQGYDKQRNLRGHFGNS